MIRAAILFLAATLAPPAAAQAPSAVDTEALAAKQEHYEGRYDEITKRLAEEKERIRDLLGREGSLLDELDRTNNLLNARTRELEDLKRQERTLTRDIETTEGEIRELTTRLERQRKLLTRRLRGLYHHYRDGEIASLVSTGDYHAFIKESRLLSYLTHSDRNLIERFRETRLERNTRKKRLEELQLETRRNREQAARKKKEVEIEKGRKEILLEAVREDKTHAKRLAGELQAAATRLKTMIREIEEKRRAAEALAGRIDFADLKGRLQSPVVGRVTVPFGRQIDPLFDTPVFRNGIEIQTKPGEIVRAVHDGTVVFADWFKGFGQLVILTHGNGYHTLYAQLSEMYVRLGQTVGSDQALGRVGNTGSFAGPTLYFELRQKGQPVDPLGWLRTGAGASERALYIK